MYIQIHGARGSMPVGTSEFSRYGGDTTCYTLHHDDGSLIAIVDAGTGLRRALPDSPETAGNHTLLLTHYHWDHIQGLSMSAPMWRRDVHLRIIGPGDPRFALGGAITPPWFPVSIEDMDIEFEPVGRSFAMDGVSVATFPLNHPQGGTGYRFESGNQSIVIATDHEAGSEVDAELVEMAYGTDVLIHDAQYLPTEIEAKRGWGHSTWEQATANSAKAGVKQLVFASHDPTRSDEEMDTIVHLAEQRTEAVSAATPGHRYVPR